MTVLMFITYHHNFCSHHGHHLCRGKIGDMMAFPLSQLRAQSSPTSPSSVCTPGCTTMVEMSHTRNELVFVVRDQWTDDSAGLTGELADEWRHLLITCNQLQNLALCLHDQIGKRKLKNQLDLNLKLVHGANYNHLPMRADMRSFNWRPRFTSFWIPVV